MFFIILYHIILQNANPLCMALYTIYPYSEQEYNYSLKKGKAIV